MKQTEMYFLADIANANIVVAAMQAENMKREHLGQAMAYDESAFMKIIEDYGLSYNQVVIRSRDL